MSYSKTPNLEVFAEALSVPPILHIPADRPLTVLTYGPYALPMAKLALRYPSTKKVIIVARDGAPVPQDRRVKLRDNLQDMPAGFDLIASAVPGVPPLAELRKLLKPDGALVVAVDQFGNGRKIKDLMTKLGFAQVLAYREHVPEPALFLMASNRRFGKPLRPFPAGLKRLTPRYLPSLFALAKDEYAALYGAVS